MLPDYNDPITFACTFNMYFINKIANIRAEIPLLESSLPPYSFWSMDSMMHTCANLLEWLTMIPSKELIRIVSVINKTTCLSDPFPSKLLMSHLPTIIDTIMHIINLCLSTSCCCCLPTPMTLASGGSPMFPLVVHQPASTSIWPAVQSLRRGLSTNPGAIMWCVCGYS